MAWTSIADTRIDLKSPLDEDLFEDLRDNVVELRESVFGLTFAEQTHNTGTWTALYTFSFYIPTLTQETGRERGFGVRVQAKVDSGVTAELRWRKPVTPLGSTITVTGTSYAVTSESLAQSATFAAGGLWTINVEARITAGSGSVYVKSEDLIACRVLY